MKLEWMFVATLVLAVWTSVGHAQTTQPALAAGATTTTAAHTTGPSGEQLMNQLMPPGQPASGKPLPPATTSQMTDATSGKGAVAPGAPIVATLREGTFIINRVGRLTHSADGQQAEFAFDADGRAMRDPPMIILPNLKLMQMENAMSGNSRDLRFRVSGTVTEYKGRNYVLLDKVVVVPDIDQQF